MSMNRRNFLFASLATLAACARPPEVPGFSSPEDHIGAMRQKAAENGVTRLSILAPITTGYVLTGRSDRRGRVNSEGGEYHQHRSFRNALSTMGFRRTAGGYGFPASDNFADRTELGTPLIDFVNRNRRALDLLGVNVDQHDYDSADECTCGTNDASKFGDITLSQRVNGKFFKNAALVRLVETLGREINGQEPAILAPFFNNSDGQPLVARAAYGVTQASAPTANTGALISRL